MSFGAIAGGIAAPIIGGIIGNEASRGDRNAAGDLQRQALEEFLKAKIPNPKDQEIFLEQLRSTGQLSPEMEQAIQQSRSEMGNIQADPRLKDAQLQALMSLQEIGNEGGMSAVDKVRFNEMNSDLNREASANQAAVMQDFARRGQSGSGMELAAQLMNQQASADRASRQGMDIKAQAEMRALEALMQGGQMAGSMRDQDFNQAARQAEAQDAINRFNTQNRQDVMSRNIQARNQAQATNLQNNQRIADTNVGLRNQQQMHNKDLLQQQFDNQLNRAGAMAGQYNNMANAKNAAADRTANMWAGIGSGVGQGAMAYGASSGGNATAAKSGGFDVNDERLKKFGGMA